MRENVKPKEKKNIKRDGYRNNTIFSTLTYTEKELTEDKTTMGERNYGCGKEIRRYVCTNCVDDVNSIKFYMNL